MFKVQISNSIHNVPASIWDTFVTKDAVGLEREHLQAIEQSRINNINPYYLIVYSDNEPIGIAYGIIFQIDFAKLADTYPLNVLNTLRTWKPDFMKLKIIEFGFIASLGSTINCKPGFQSDFLCALSKEIDRIATVENADLCLIRDINDIDYKTFETIGNFGYCSAMGYPIARMQLHWDCFADYLSSLKSKKRNQFQQRREKLRKPELSVEIIEDYAPYAHRLAELWENVAKNNNGYEHERLTPDFFREMSNGLKGRSHVVAIKRYGEIIAYGLNLIGDNDYFGMAEGMDYRYRDEYDLYANNIFESLNVACIMRKKTFNIGITTYDFKSAIGCELEPTFYFIKAFKNKNFSSVYTKYVKDHIKQPHNYHRVFRCDDVEKRTQLEEYETLMVEKGIELDVFSKHLNYTRVDDARAAGLYTFCPSFESAQEAVVIANNKEVIMLGSNAYLGLSTHPKVKRAAQDAIEKYGTGCSGSPMLNGTLDLHNKLSNNLARFVRKQDALIFSTGYQTNVGVLSALANRNDIVIMDERNHASLVDGALLSRAKIVRYKHNSINSLETVIKQYADQPILVVTDSLFSMEGSIINLPEIIRLKKQYHFRLMLDESHALGVIGKTGGGVTELYNLGDDVDIIMGTFSKSFAAVGGFIAGDKKIIDTIKHTSRAHMFSASLPPSATATVLESLKIITNEPERRKQLIENAGFLAKGLENLGYEIDFQGGPIISLFCGHEYLAIAAYQKLFENGVFVNPVTSPAVPKNHEILRISLMATHTREMLTKALAVFEQLKTPYWPNN